MATSKLLKPTNVTISIPEFTDQPDQRVNSNCIDKEADAINALNDQIENFKGDSSWTVLNSTYPTWYRKVAGIVFVNMRLSGGSTPTDATLLGTLPTGYRPTHETVCATQNLRGNLFVKPNGEVTINANSGQTLNNFMGAILSFPA